MNAIAVGKAVEGRPDSNVVLMQVTVVLVAEDDLDFETAGVLVVLLELLVEVMV